MMIQLNPEVGALLVVTVQDAAIAATAVKLVTIVKASIVFLIETNLKGS